MPYQDRQLIRIGHSPDPDDAFMFFALAQEKIDTGRYRFEHELCDIETLNRRAQQAELELTAISVHAYAYLADKYVLCTCGASMGDGYGPMVVAPEPYSPDQLARLTIAVPGTWTTAFLTLKLFAAGPLQYEVVPFDQILPAVAQGQWNGKRLDAGLVIHEGQLTYPQMGLHLVVDLGQWWKQHTGLPLPLGANALRRDLGPQTLKEVDRLLRASIDYGLEHRSEALAYAMGFGRGLDTQKTDQFVGMYVNHWTQDFGPTGRKAVAELLRRGYEARILPSPVEPEFVQ
ncbi:MAG: 1,4-dihydroxy-6-naphtoate synthase [Pirellulaceae bacterium]|nr:MAG: 1,4-dihydroxy-6-naphtoate synthase [Pirellulaceae bacterium]